MNNDVFIGTGHNPDGMDLPVGFGMQLAQVPHAIEAYGRLSDTQKRAVIHYVQSGTTGEEAESLVMGAVKMLSEGRTDFF